MNKNLKIMKNNKELPKFTLPEPHIGGLEKGKIYLYKSEPKYSETEVLEILIKFWMWSTIHTRKEHLISWFKNLKIVKKNDPR